MRRRVAGMAMAAFLVLGAGAARAAGGVTVDAATLRSGLIVTAVPALHTETPMIAAYGRVIDPTPVFTLRSRIVAARAADTLAAATLARTRRLYHAAGNVSEASVQQAEAGATSARARLSALRSAAAARFGAALGAAIAGNGAPFRAIEAGGSLVSVVQGGAALNHLPAAATARLANGGSAALRAIGPAGRLPPGLLGQAFLFTGPALPVGTPLAVSLPVGRKIAGYDVPVSALVWHHDRAFAFVRTAPHAFAAVPLGGAGSLRRGDAPGTRFVPATALPPHPAIVVRGAGLLNSMLSGGGGTAGDGD
ncbi:hypothetical protein [Acidiphilium sp.]|uniref:hypothetical protein n=1 Tax=Acidiphilium sp. TaxID=527 RepID=UPI003CFC0965